MYDYISPAWLHIALITYPWLSGVPWYLRHNCIEDTIVHHQASAIYLITTVKTRSCYCYGHTWDHSEHDRHFRSYGQGNDIVDTWYFSVIAKHMVQKNTGAKKFQFVSWILIKKNWCVINLLDPGRCDCEFYDFHTHYEVKEVFPWRGITGIFFSVSVVKFTHQYSIAWNRVLIRLDVHLLILWCINLETMMI